jgi:hypothetical protein
MAQACRMGGPKASGFWTGEAVVELDVRRCNMSLAVCWR